MSKPRKPRRKPTPDAPRPVIDGNDVADLAASTGRALVLSERADVTSPLPDLLPILPLRSDVVFPQTVVPLVVNRGAGIRLIDEVNLGDKALALATCAASPTSTTRRPTTSIRPSASAAS